MSTALPLFGLCPLKKKRYHVYKMTVETFKITSTIPGLFGFNGRVAGIKACLVGYVIILPA